MKMKTRFVYNLFFVVICLACMLLFGTFAVSAQEDGTKKITGTFTTLDHTVSREYVFSEEFFRLPSDEYSHDLARLSLGMALSAFRDTEHPQTQDDYLIAFLEGMGFEQIETDPYRKDPSSYSISYGFAQLHLKDMTVVAVAVCGGNYSAEWASNLTVGDQTRPEGFQNASLQIQEALKDYMERHPTEGTVKLWIAGYSRAGAVSNITAADCTDSGMFTEVYAYTFATPRTTREPGDYRNIFNILQKNDMVPKIPLADWGYERYGIDLYLISPEIDMDREEVLRQAEILYKEMIGSNMVTNFEINYQLRTLSDYLYLIVPDSATYKEILQPLILDIMTRSGGTKDALTVLLEALQSYSLEDKEHEEELRSMIDYLEIMINIYYLQDRISEFRRYQWDPQFGTTNLFNDHFPFEYLSMMFASDDSDELFSEKTKYVRLVIYGIVDAEIKNDGGEILKTIMADGTELVDGVESPDSLPDVEYTNEKMVITLPADQSYEISIRSKSTLPQTVTYTGLLFSGNTVRAEADDLYSFLMNSGDTAVIKTSTNGKAIEPEGSDYTDVSEYIGSIYSPTTAMRLENNNIMHLTISGFVNKLLLIIVFLIIQLIIHIIVNSIRKKKGLKRNKAVEFIWHSVNAIIFAILELAMWYFVPVLTIAKFIPGFLVFITIAVYYLKGYWEFNKDLKALIILLTALAVYEILDSMLIGDFKTWKALMMLIIYVVFMIAGLMLLWRKPKE